MLVEDNLGLAPLALLVAGLYDPEDTLENMLAKLANFNPDTQQIYFQRDVALVCPREGQGQDFLRILDGDIHWSAKVSDLKWGRLQHALCDHLRHGTHPGFVGGCPELLHYLNFNPQMVIPDATQVHFVQTHSRVLTVCRFKWNSTPLTCCPISEPGESVGADPSTMPCIVLTNASNTSLWNIPSLVTVNVGWDLEWDVRAFHLVSILRNIVEWSRTTFGMYPFLVGVSRGTAAFLECAGLEPLLWQDFNKVILISGYIRKSWIQR